MDVLVRSALLGWTSGARSMSGIAAQVVATPELSAVQPEKTLGKPWVKVALALLAAAELVGDKLPATPSRLAPPGLVPRLVSAAGATVLAAREQDPSRALPMAVWAAVPVAVGASLASAYVGHAWRGWASDRLGRDVPGALVEDALALTSAAIATRR